MSPRAATTGASEGLGWDSHEERGAGGPWQLRATQAAHPGSTRSGLCGAKEQDSLPERGPGGHCIYPQSCSPDPHSRSLWPDTTGLEQGQRLPEPSPQCPNQLVIKGHLLFPPRSPRMLWPNQVGKGTGRKRGSWLTYPDGDTCSVTLSWKWSVGSPLNKEPGDVVAETSE